MLETAILKVYTTEGVKGPFVSEDDKATLIVAGFWEEYFDLEGMLKQLEEIKKMVAARPAAPQAPPGPNVKDVVFTLGNNPLRGSSAAKVTLVELTDYQ